VFICGASSAQVETPSLRIAFDGQKRQFSVSELLASPAVRTLEIPRDPAYGAAMRYEAIPLLELLRGIPAGGIDTLEARATDGFVSQLPWSLIAGGANGGAVAWIAIEDPSRPWPLIKGKSYSAGPFYLVWQHPERSGVTSEQWPYALASLTAVDQPLLRWPQLSINASIPKEDPARRGQAVFIIQCLPCHRLNGAGEGNVGPDLGEPMPVLAYFTEAGLKKLLRDPASVRTWPQQQMPRFDSATLSDSDIDAVIAYLRRVAGAARR
jgi:mono/diheme cytochrome c family protein